MLAKIKQIIAPPTFPEDDEKTRIASLLNILLWALTFIFIINTINAYFYGEGIEPILLNAATILVNGGLLIALHRGHVKLAVWLTIGIYFMLVTAIGFWLTGLSIIIITSYMVLVLLAGLLAGPATSAVTTVLVIMLGGLMLSLETRGLLTLPLTGSHTINATAAAGNLVALTVILNLTLNTLNKALAQMRRSNKQLQEVQALLEMRVAARTRDLALAAEVGRIISRQVGDLDTLLRDAVDLIMERFDLYHTQIYLADNKQEMLLLKAGTGRVGAQLVQRRHSLPIGPGSINGIAAAEKRSVIVADTAVSPLFKPNALLPKTRSEMAVPLIVGDVVLGALNLQSDVVNGLSEESLPAFETLAGQIAIAVENANLFAETIRARAEIEGYLRVMTREGWESYQDAIGRPEVIGFTYENESTRPLVNVDDLPAPGENGLQVPIMVANELIGTIQLEADDAYFWTEETKELVTAVARQVGQQAENLRLLAETNHYRYEAEQAARRLRGEAWQDYLAGDPDLQQGFVYDQQQLKPLDENMIAENNRDDKTIQQPLIVQGEIIGELFIDGGTDPEVETLAAMVAERLSTHLENLRLSAQTEKALAETAEQAHRLAALNEISRDLSAATDVTETFSILSRHMTSVIPHDFLSFAMAKPDGSSAKIVAVMNDQPVTLFEDQPIAGTVVEVAIKQRQLVYLADIREHDYVDTNVMAERAGARSVMVAPLLTARGVLGGIDLMSNQVDGFDAQDQTLLQQIATLVASTLESQQLFVEAHRRAEKERLVNLVSQKIQGTVTIEGALETAVTELGNALQARYTQIKLATTPEAKPGKAPANELNRLLS